MGYSPWGCKELDMIEQLTHMHICGILKNYTNELLYQTEIYCQTQKANLWLPKGKGGKEG